MSCTSKTSSANFAMDGFDDDSYFFKTYVPLSNLPTPPLISGSDGSTRSCSPALSCDETLESPLIGPAVHLSHLIPTSASLLDPSVTIIHDILVKANVAKEVLALTVCVLDSLNSKFSLAWRKACPPQHPDTGVLTDDLSAIAPHIDNVRPELMVLGALAIAVKFLDDTHWSTRYWVKNIAQRRWTHEQLNVTQLCIMENLKYRILPLWNEDFIQEALADMESAGQTARRRSIAILGHNNMANRVVDGASAALDKNMPATPAFTPMSENEVGTKNIDIETQAAFGCAAAIIANEEFPVYSDPIFDFEPF